MKKKLTKQSSKIAKTKQSSKIAKSPKRKIVKRKNPYNREEEDGVNQLSIDMGDQSYSSTQQDLEKLKRNYYKCHNEFLEQLYQKELTKTLRKGFNGSDINDAIDIVDRKFKPLLHFTNYCSDPKCNICTILKQAEMFK